MNRFFTLLLAASCLTAVGQEVNDVDCTEVSITVSSGSADYQVSWWLNPQNDQSTSAAGGAPFSANYCLEPGASMCRSAAAKLAVVAANRLTLRHQPSFHSLDI